MKIKWSARFKAIKASSDSVVLLTESDAFILRGHVYGHIFDAIEKEISVYEIDSISFQENIEVVSRVESLQSEQSGQLVFAYLLARILAASPEDSVRDGERALGLAESLYKQIPVAENAETLAMAYAETGRFDDAIGMQQEAIANAMMSGRFDLLPRLQADLDTYNRHKPCRTPFTREDPLLQPRPVDPVLPLRDYPATKPY